MWGCFCGVGRRPDDMRSELEGEGLLLLDERVPASATYRNFRAPGRCSLWERQWGAGTLALTETRLFGRLCGAVVINVPRGEPRIRLLRLSVGGGGRQLCIACDAGLFHCDWSGEIEYRFRVADPARYVYLLTKDQDQGQEDMPAKGPPSWAGGRPPPRG